MRLPENPEAENPLVPVVRALPPEARTAMYRAASSGPLLRHTWNGCVFSQAGAVLGKPVGNTRQAAKALGSSRRSVIRFIAVWDRLSGSDERCTELLLEALVAVGVAADARDSQTDDRVPELVHA